MQQLLFQDAFVERPPAVPVRTSIAAAEAIAKDAPTLRGKVYAELVRRGDRGATRQELADTLGLKLQTVVPRVYELRKQNLVWDGDDVRDGGKVVRAKRNP